MPVDFAAMLKRNIRRQRRRWRSSVPATGANTSNGSSSAKREETRAKRIATAVEWLALGRTNWKYAELSGQAPSGSGEHLSAVHPREAFLGRWVDRLLRCRSGSATRRAAGSGRPAGICTSAKHLPAADEQRAVGGARDRERAPEADALDPFQPAVDGQHVAQHRRALVVDLRTHDHGILLGLRAISARLQPSSAARSVRAVSMKRRYAMLWTTAAQSVSKNMIWYFRADAGLGGRVGERPWKRGGLESQRAEQVHLRGVAVFGQPRREFPPRADAGSGSMAMGSGARSSTVKRALISTCEAAMISSAAAPSPPWVRTVWMARSGRLQSRLRCPSTARRSFAPPASICATTAAAASLDSGGRAGS